jgi:ribosomal protein L11 methyltransferase
VSWRVTVPCTRAQGEAIAGGDELLPNAVLVADEPDPKQPDSWLIHAYLEHPPTAEDLEMLARLGSGEPRIEELGEADWVSMSQAGLQPIRAGRFYVHTPMYRNVPPGLIAFEIDASLAFGTGQHATTSGCLAALNELECAGANFANIADIGTGTGLLAEADGMDSPLLAARAPFDLIIANILAGPLTDLAPHFAVALAPGGTVVLAGVLDTQADALARAYADEGLRLRDRGSGEWPVLVLSR